MVIDGGTFGVFSNNNGPEENDDRDVKLYLENCTIKDTTGKGIYCADAKVVSIKNCVIENVATGTDTGTTGDYGVDINLIGVTRAIIEIEDTEFKGYQGAKAAVKVTQRGGPSDKGAGDIPMDKGEASISSFTMKGCSFDTETPVDVRIGTEHKTPDQPNLDNTTADFPVTIQDNTTDTRVYVAATGDELTIPAGASGYKSETGDFVIIGGEEPEPDGPVSIDDESFDTLEDAIKAVEYGDIISLNEDVTVNDMGENGIVAVVIPSGVTLNGNGHTINAGNIVNKHILGATTGDVAIVDVNIEGKAGVKSGICASGPDVTLEISDVEVNNCDNCGVQVTNGAQVILDEYYSNGNAWGSVNADKGGGGNIPHVTFNSGVMNENVEIYTELVDEDCITAPDLVEVIGVGDTLKGFKYYTSDISKLGIVKVNDTVYEDMNDAIAALEDGDELTLYADYDKPIRVNGIEITFNLNGYTLTPDTAIWNPDAGIISMLASEGGANVTITGNGIIKALADDSYAVDVQPDSTMTIENGTFVGNITAAYVQGGHLYVKGGDFSIQQLEPTYQDERFTLNCLDSAYHDGTATIEVTGGTFNKFDPANNLAEGENTNFCPEGYSSVKEGDKYTVVKA